MNRKSSNYYYAWVSLLLFSNNNKITGAESSKSLLRGMNNNEESIMNVEPPTTRNLIIGGRVAKPNDYPYFTHLEGIACGGSLIAPDIVLTAGHCKLSKPADYKTVHVGRYDYRAGGKQDGAELFEVENHYRHPDYDGQLCCGYKDNLRFYGVSKDFMLLKLNGESTKQVVSLDKPTNPTPISGEEFHVMGFGDITYSPNAYVEPDRLYEVTVNYLSNEQCTRSSIYPSALLPPETMCATDYRQDGCQGGK
jgi:secreted trypsin-like serine protease